jgi:protein disulfide-isomerase
MRFLPLLFLLGASAVGPALAIDQDEDPSRENTYFDGVMVPPTLDLTPDTFEKEIKRSRWMVVKHFRYARARSEVVGCMNRRY